MKINKISESLSNSKVKTRAEIKNITDFPYHEYDENGNVKYVEHNDGYFVEYKYDEKGNKIYSKNSYGLTVNMSYDDDNNLIRKEDGDNLYRYLWKNGEIVMSEEEGKIVLVKDKVSFPEINRFLRDFIVNLILV